MLIYFKLQSQALEYLCLRTGLPFPILSQYSLFFWPPDVKTWLIGKDPDAGKDYEMVGWHHQLDGHEFEQAPGVGDGQGKPGMLQSMGSQRVGDNWVTELNWTELEWEQVDTMGRGSGIFFFVSPWWNQS